MNSACRGLPVIEMGIGRLRCVRHGATFTVTIHDTSGAEPINDISRNPFVGRGNEHPRPA